MKVIQEELYETYAPIHVRLPYQQGALISLFHEAGQVERIEHGRGGVRHAGTHPRALAGAVQRLAGGRDNHHEPEEEEEI